MNVLLAVDHSPESLAALELLQAVILPAGSTVFFLQVVEPRAWAKGTEGQHELQVGSILAAAEAQALEAAKQELKRLCQRRWTAKPTPTILVVGGIPGAEILAAIDKYGIDLVVVGTHGRTGLKRFLLGSVSEWVLAEAPCSVLIARKAWASRKQTQKGLRVVFGTDGSPDAEWATRWFRQIRFPPLSRVTVCHVLEDHSSVGKELAARLGVAGKSALKHFSAKVLKDRVRAARRLLTTTASAMKRRGLRITKSLVHGHAADQLLKLVNRQKTDLLVLGSRGLTGLRRVLLGSVSRNVATHAPCSVLVVRRQGKNSSNPSRRGP